MNQLDNISMHNSTITDSMVTSCNNFSTSQYAPIVIQSESIITIDNYSIKVSELAKKLQLLDRLIQEYLPEELI